MPVDMSVIETVFRNYLENCCCRYNTDAVWSYDKLREDIMINYNHFSVNGESLYPADEVYGTITTYTRPSNTIQRWKSHKVTVRVEDVREFLIHEDCGNTEGFTCTDEDIYKFVNEVLKPMTEPEDLQDSCMVHEAAIGSPDNIQKCITFYLYDEDITMSREYME